MRAAKTYPIASLLVRAAVVVRRGHAHRGDAQDDGSPEEAQGDLVV